MFPRPTNSDTMEDLRKIQRIFLGINFAENYAFLYPDGARNFPLKNDPHIKIIYKTLCLLNNRNKNALSFKILKGDLGGSDYK